MVEERPPETARRSYRWSRPLVIALTVLAAVVIYAFAFDKTDVDLGEIQSETRQQQLFRILRALAQPELVEYDTEDVVTEVPIAVPCGPQVPATTGPVEVVPSCVEPGGEVTIRGSGFDPGETVSIAFVPRSEFDIVLTMGRVTVDDSGGFEGTFTVPDRPSEELQAIRVVSQRPIGSWGNRVETFVDENQNGVRDQPRVPESGEYTVRLPIPLPEQYGTALLDPSRNLEEFVSFGPSFVAIDGQANGQTAVPVEEREPGDVYVVGLEEAEDGLLVRVAAPPGTDLSGWRVAVYDAATGAVEGTAALADSFRLSPRISEEARLTWDKIIETVALALVATTAGLMVAVPLSFIAARNIMKDIAVTVTNLALTLLALPVGAGIGLAAARTARTVIEPFRDNLLFVLAGVVLIPWGIARVARWALPPVELEPPGPVEKALRRAALIAAGAFGIVVAFLLSILALRVGEELRPMLGPFGFLAGFVRSLGELGELLTPVAAALGGAGVLAGLAGRLGYLLRSALPRPILVPLNLVLAGLAGAVWAAGLGGVVEWLYRLQNPTATFWIPAAVGALGGLVVAAVGMRAGQVKIGLTIYYIARTVFNTLRSIEPLVMVIVFVVWVGIGPFAGSLALALHTAAALAKLYSEQVESILPGPIEAVRATGATRLQTIVYAVVPQIVPPYISFTMYRWDINVRMSTILGFAGGGGIGFILQQNVNLFQYRAAAVQMLAIAIVVASMDWLSSRLRERFV
ncbi:MAG: hypothetical protein KatS3mg011_1460 [Acidimicrobiia bacterium]|nr:MAG: hypothetical protein KatS3mg011_1460 [Acidimicrobiia bacterium]